MTSEISYTHKRNDPCDVCGLSFWHEHPDIRKPEEFVMLASLLHTDFRCSVCSKPIKSTAGTCLCLPSHGSWHLECDPHHKSVTPHEKPEKTVLLSDIIKQIEAMKYTKVQPTVFEVSYNLAIDNIVKSLLDYESSM